MASSSISWFANASGRRAELLPRSFFERHTLEVARELLGKLLIVRAPSGATAGRIVETEAYRGGDPASHSCRGETPRASVMFGEAGRAYVYFIYGMYEMLNFVTEPPGSPGAVLIRAVEPLYGEELMRRRRKASGSRFDLARGPGKLCRAMGVEMSHNRASLRGPVLYVADEGWRPERVAASPRVGISQGTDKDWRFFVEGNPFVSRAPQAMLDGTACLKRRQARARARRSEGERG